MMEDICTYAKGSGMIIPEGQLSGPAMLAAATILEDAFMVNDTAASVDRFGVPGEPYIELGFEGEYEDAPVITALDLTSKAIPVRAGWVTFRSTDGALWRLCFRNGRWIRQYGFVAYKDVPEDEAEDRPQEENGLPESASFFRQESVNDLTSYTFIGTEAESVMRMLGEFGIESHRLFNGCAEGNTVSFGIVRGNAGLIYDLTRLLPGSVGYSSISWGMLCFCCARDGVPYDGYMARMIVDEDSTDAGLKTCFAEVTDSQSGKKLLVGGKYLLPEEADALRDIVAGHQAPGKADR